MDNHTANTNTDLTGKFLDRYQILEKIGSGGMAVVYRAFDQKLETDVAIKMIQREKLSSETFHQYLSRFHSEIRKMTGLSHPNIISILDSGEYDGLPFLVMKYLSGGSLKQRLEKQDEPMQWEKAVNLLAPIVQALEYAHRKGIIHRDIKPANILFDESGEPILTDFGIAKALESEETTQLTSTGVGIGTPEYMAPEQALGRVIDPRADIYSLGIVFYEMVTGRKPFQADTPLATLLKQVNDPLPPPRKYAPGLPKKLEQVLIKALAKQPQVRYQSMQAFGAALAELIKEKRFVRLPLPPSYNRWVYLPGVLGIIAVVIMLQSSVISPPKKNTPIPTSTATMIIARSPAATVTTQLPTTTVSINSNPTITPVLVPTPLGGGSGEIVFVGENGLYSYNFVDQKFVEKVMFPTSNKKIKFDPNGNNIFISNYDNDCALMKITQIGSVNCVLNRTEYVWNFDWLSDDEIVVSYSKKLLVVNSNSLEVTPIGNGDRPFGRNFAISPDKRHIITVGYEIPGLFLFNPENPNPINIFNHLESFYYFWDVKWSPHGDQISFTRNSTAKGFQLCVSDLNGNNFRILYENSERSILYGFQWAPNGGSIIFDCENGDICLWDIFSEELSFLTSGPATDRNPTWSPDGQFVAFTSDREGEPDIYIMSPNGGNLINISKDADLSFGYPMWVP